MTAAPMSVYPIRPLRGETMPDRATTAGTQFENKVRGSLKRIGFRDVDGGTTFIVGGFQIDAVGGWDDMLLVVEATQTSSRGVSIRDRIVQLRGKSGDLRRAFGELEGYSAYRRFEFALVTQGFPYTESDRQLANSQPKIHLVDNQVLEYYQKLAGMIGKQASLFNLLGELGVEPRDLAVHRTPAFKVELQRNLIGYLFFCEPRRLLEIAYVARRETGREHYYQRMLTASRLRNIRGFIDGGGVFPNNVILAFDNRPQFRSQDMREVDSPSWLEWGVLTFPKSYRAAWIIDGQHRLYAFGDDQPASRLQKLPVFAFERLKESKQAEFFIQINREQKPVSPDLIWDLEADLRPDSPRGRIALTAKRLNQSGPLRNRIYYPLSGDAPREKLKISSICNDISELRLLDEKTKNMTQSQRNPLIAGVPLEGRVKRVADGFATFINTVLAVQDAGVYETSVILRPGGITLILNVYEQVLIKLGGRPRMEQLQEYAAALVLALDQVVGGAAAARTFVKNRLTSYAQRREVTVQVVNTMRDVLDDQSFGQRIAVDTPIERRVALVERKLAQLVATTLGIQTMRDLKQRAPENVWRGIRRRLEGQSDEPLHSLISLGETRQIVNRQDNRQVVVEKLMAGGNGFRDEAEVFVALDGLIELRNPLQHGRAVRNQQLGEAYLTVFERVLERV